MTDPRDPVTPLTAREEAVYREGLRTAPSIDHRWGPDPVTLHGISTAEWADRCRRLLATLDAARQPVTETALREALAAAEAVVRSVDSPGRAFPNAIKRLRAALAATRDPEPSPAAIDRERLDEAWADVVAITPKGWLFHGVEVEDNSMDGGDWGPGWVAVMSWPGHCQYDDCDHDDAFRIGKGATPVAALRSLVDDFDWTDLPTRYRDSVRSQNA